MYLEWISAVVSSFDDAQSETPSKVIDFEHLQIFKGNLMQKYVQIITSGESSFSWPYSCETTDTLTVKDVLVDFSRVLGVDWQRVSKQCIHLKN